MTYPHIALFGGTFDPIHNGHLTVANALVEELALTRLLFLPNHIPPHRSQPLASPKQRSDMVKLAIANFPKLVIDTRELRRASPSYTIDSLREIRQEWGDHYSISFVMGYDSLVTLPTWHQWQQLSDYCHIIICPRPHYHQHMLSVSLQRWLEQHVTQDATQLRTHNAGCVYFSHTPFVALSATDIRQHYQQQKPLDGLLPCAVQHYIKQCGLYAPDEKYGRLANHNNSPYLSS